jgi:hypothetical protein
MGERVGRVASLPNETGSAEERMLRADLAQEMVARKARREAVKQIARARRRSQDGQALAQAGQLAAAPALAVVAHAAQLVIGRIERALEPGRIAALRGHVVLVEGGLPQRFVGALVVELVPEAFEALLLPGQIGGRWACGLGSVRNSVFLEPVVDERSSRGERLLTTC